MNQRGAQKMATRRALSAAAIDLFTTKGFDETRVEDIAAAVGVTARTFFLHFPSKEASAFPDHDERVDALAVSLASDDADDPLPALRDQIVLGIRQTTESRIRAKRYRLINEIDALRERDVLGDLDYEHAIADHLISRWGGDTDTRFHAHAVAASAMGIARAALTAWDSDRMFDPVAAAEARLKELA